MLEFAAAASVPPQHRSIAERGSVQSCRRATWSLVIWNHDEEIKLNGEDLLIMKESDVMGVINQTATVKKAA